MLNLYYESHITIEPVFEDRLERLKEIIEPFGFRVADLLMKKREEDTEERSAHDTFCSSRDHLRYDLQDRMINCIKGLTEQGYKVWRYKIEDVVLDSKIEDTLKLL